MIEMIKRIFNKNVIIGGLIFTVLLFALMYILQVGVFPYFSAQDEQKAKVVLTPYIDSDEQDDGPEIQPTATLQIESLPGVVSLGMTVKIIGTGEEGLRMRKEAGMDQTVMFLAGEGEVFTIIGGPVIKDSLIWWKIQGEENGQKTGWSVQDYLTAVNS